MELDIMRKHIGEHAYLRGIGDIDSATESFIQDYGWLMRELYCSRMCPVREVCPVAQEMLSTGDLLRNRAGKQAALN